MWGLSIIISFFILRKAVNIQNNFFENDLGFLITIIILCILPFVNILISLGLLVATIIDENNYDVNDVVKIIFFIKKEKK
jgi:hypothetical protein